MVQVRIRCSSVTLSEYHVGWALLARVYGIAGLLLFVHLQRKASLRRDGTVSGMKSNS
jgi:hypothetical protein